MKQFEIEQDRAVITLSIAGNAAHQISTDFFSQLAEWLDTLDENQVECLIIQGRGKHFCSGSDTEEIKRIRPADYRAIHQRDRAVLQRLSQLPFPVVALIDGMCLGSGMEIALQADFRLAGKTARLALPEVEFGIIPALGGTFESVWRMGLCQGLHFLLRSGFVRPQEALELGLIDGIY